MTKIKNAPVKRGAAVGVKPTDLTKEDLYYEMVDGNGMVHRIANMQNHLVCKRKGTIRIEAVRRGKDKQANFGIRTTFDSKNRIIYGIPIDIDSKTKKIIFKGFTLTEFKEFNLSNADEAEEWAVIRHHEVLNGARPAFKTYDVDAEAEAEIKEISLISEAVGIAKDMKLKDLIPCARFFGHVPDGMSAVALQSEIMKIAKNTPTELIDYWNGDNRELIDLFNAAKSVGLIHHDLLKGWMFKKNLPLGSTQETALSYIKKDAVFSKSLYNEVKSIDHASKAVLTGASTKKKTSFDEQEENLDIFDLKIKAKLLDIPDFENMDPEVLRKRVEVAENIELDEEQEEA